jgi:acylphosphatase
MIACRRFLISGRVQGVAYRAWTREQARRLRLTGWAANLADGRVEIVVCGELAAIDSLRSMLHDGPSAAHVTAVEEQAAEADGAVGFAVR